MKKIIIFFILFKLNLYGFNQFIKATYFFGNSSPFNFWNSSDFYLTKSYFTQIKKDGFNTIILIVPWREFQNDLSCYEKLNFYLKEAEKSNLNVILRVSYFWDLYKSKIPLPELFLKLVTDKQIFKQWLNYLKKINNICKNYDNFLFAFISWEDFWIYTNKGFLKQFPEYKNYLKCFQNFVYKKYQKKIYDLPSRYEYNFKYLLEFYDYLITEKLYKSAQNVFPELSIEARVDYDPIFKNGELIEWYIHQKTFKPYKFRITTIYYAPFMGQKNIGDEISCNNAINVFNSLLKNFKQFSNNRELFIDQFNFISYNPLLKNKTKIKKNSICCFLKKSEKYLLKYTVGYSLWNYKFYKVNLIYNSKFKEGFKGWERKGKPSIVDFNKKKFVLLKGKSYIQQKINNYLFDYIKSYGNFHLCFNAFSTKKTILKIKINKNFFKMNIKNLLKMYCINLKNLERTPLISFSVKEGKAYLSDVVFYNIVDKSGLYDLKNKKLPYTDCVIDLNKKIHARNNKKFN